MRKPYWSDVGDEEWGFVGPYLIGMPNEDVHPPDTLREVFNGLRWIVRTGAPWQLLPHAFPAWAVVEQQTQHWLTSGCFAAIVHDLSALLRLAEAGSGSPGGIARDRGRPRSPPVHEGHAVGNGQPQRPGVQGAAAGQTLGERLALHIETSTAPDRAQVAGLITAVQVVVDVGEALATVNLNDRGVHATPATPRIRLQVVQAPLATRGFLLVPERWLVDPGFPWRRRLRQLVRDYDQLPTRVARLRTWPRRD